MIMPSLSAVLAHSGREFLCNDGPLLGPQTFDSLDEDEVLVQTPGGGLIGLGVVRVLIIEVLVVLIVVHYSLLLIKFIIIIAFFE
jgi:hypothetical protein